MATTPITGLAAVLAANLDDTAVIEVDDKNAATRKATVAQVRTQLNSGPQAYVPGVAGAAQANVNLLSKLVAAIANNVATAVVAVSIPNGAHAAILRVTLVGSLGAGGAIGAHEASQTISYDIVITRVAGVAAVAAISVAYGSAASAVAGAATVTVTAALAAMAGAVGATNTFNVNVTIVRSGGASTNHTCTVLAELVNAEATGVTIT